MFTLEALEAKQGDALLLRYGTASRESLILIDAGPPGVYENVVRERLEAMRTAGKDPLPLRLVMVSHVDEDHITGVVKLFTELKTLKDDREPLPYDVAELWHNSFKDGLKVVGASLAADVQSSVKPADLEAGRIPSAIAVSAEVRVDLASIAQGGALRDLAKSLAIAVNEGFTPLVMAEGGTYPRVSMGDGLTFRVLAPSAVRLDALKAEWARKTKGKKASPAALADYVDQSVYNLSSIVVLAEHGGKTMLLAGDARGDDVVAALEGAKLVKKSQALHVDLLKVPHHGSWRNLSDDFFTRIEADHYVFSANGKYGNPDPETLRSLIAARGTASYTLWLTNKVAPAMAAIKAARKKGMRFQVEVRAAKAAGVEIAL